VRAWWDLEGRGRYGQSTRILLTGGSGGANGRSKRLWKVTLTRLARDIGRPVRVCQYPAGTSKWNRIEHRLFAPISVGMRARPPVDLATVVGVIGATTRTGLDVTIRRDPGDYPTGTKISNRQMKSLPITGEGWHPEWNDAWTAHPPDQLRRLLWDSSLRRPARPTGPLPTRPETTGEGVTQALPGPASRHQDVGHDRSG
jgi:Rhodopirellula transposase DDE domain